VCDAPVAEAYITKLNNSKKRVVVVQGERNHTQTNNRACHPIIICMLIITYLLDSIFPILYFSFIIKLYTNLHVFAKRVRAGWPLAISWLRDKIHARQG
jgi:hypothetical protein